ncbi:hypothetical protein RAC81_13090 [Microbacterium sp. CR_7]
MTTVVQPLPSIAADAVTLLIDRVRGGTGALCRNPLAPQLQVGGSTEQEPRADS